MSNSNIYFTVNFTDIRMWILLNFIIIIDVFYYSIFFIFIIIKVLYI